ncbi:hypothetical protein QAD02_013332 [Eretmocerus hayati]|uniref:Uncharacterized protein n=1 Tax=Eretmocerus hayati TaxID=131215 RepID=A0ACC2P1U2_9HYME|nr:hypothetical protein QAD02_013332 [Eretmocerus hayati]
MIGLECESSEKWKEIMTNKSKLKGTDVFIEKDLTWQEREIRRKLVGFAKEQAGKGKKTLTRSGRGQKQAAEKKMKIISCNIAGAKNISHKAWGYLKEFEIIFLAETWLEGKEEAGIRSKIGEYDITTIQAKRQNKKGRASGGMLLATKKELKAKIERLNEETLSCKVNTRKEKWSIILTYMNKAKEDNWSEKIGKSPKTSRTIQMWDEEAREKYTEERKKWTRSGEWADLKIRIKQATSVKQIEEKITDSQTWWDGGCWKKKEEVLELFHKVREDKTRGGMTTQEETSTES